MPEATIQEDRDMKPRENDVGANFSAADLNAEIFSKSKAQAMQLASEGSLRTRPRPAVCPHRQTNRSATGGGRIHALDAISADTSPLLQAQGATGLSLTNNVANSIEADSDGMGITRQHRLNTMASDLREICVVDAGSTKMRDVAVAALVRADV